MLVFSMRPWQIADRGFVSLCADKETKPLSHSRKKTGARAPVELHSDDIDVPAGGHSCRHRYRNAEGYGDGIQFARARRFCNVRAGNQRDLENGATSPGVCHQRKSRYQTSKRGAYLVRQWLPVCQAFEQWRELDADLTLHGGLAYGRPLTLQILQLAHRLKQFGVDVLELRFNYLEANCGIGRQP